jgi:hypothetical protein
VDWFFVTYASEQDMKFIFRDGPHLDNVPGLGTRTIAREKRVSRHSLAFVADCYQKSDEIDAKLVIIHRFQRLVTSVIAAGVTASVW